MRAVASGPRGDGPPQACGPMLRSSKMVSAMRRARLAMVVGVLAPQAGDEKLWLPPPSQVMLPDELILMNFIHL